MAGVNRDPLVIVSIPAVAMVVFIARGALARSGYPASIVWMLLLPHAPEEAMIVPLAMAVACFAIGLTP